jgi:Domain of unknown function DUF29
MEQASFDSLGLHGGGVSVCLYDQDLSVWAHTNAQLLRERRFGELDIEHLIEEIEDMGRSEYRAFESHLQNLLMHLLKWEFQPLFRSGSWRASIDNARVAARKLLRDNPSFKAKLTQAVEDEYPQARKNASYETGLALGTFPPAFAYSLGELMDDEWLPS